MAYTKEERDLLINAILSGLKELGCMPNTEKVDKDSFFCIALGLQENDKDRDDCKDSIESSVIE